MLWRQRVPRAFRSRGTLFSGHSARARAPTPPHTFSPAHIARFAAAEDPGASVPKVRPSTAPAASFLAHARYTTKPLPKSRIRHRRISQEPIAGPPPARPGPTPAPAYVEIPQTSPYAARAVERGLVQPPDVELSSVIESTEAVEAVAHRSAQGRRPGAVQGGQKGHGRVASSRPEFGCVVGMSPPRRTGTRDVVCGGVRGPCHRPFGMVVWAACERTLPLFRD